MNLSAFTRSVETFAEIDPEMQLNTMLAFLYVATTGRCNQKSLELALGMSNATASRSISYWSDLKKFGVPGKGFINREEDPQDRRYKILTLSTKGRKFYNKLKEKDYGKAKRSAVAG